MQLAVFYEGTCNKTYIYVQLVVFREGVDQLHPQLVIQQHHLDCIPNSAGDIQAATALLSQSQQLLCTLPLELAILEQNLQHAKASIQATDAAHVTVASL